MFPKGWAGDVLRPNSKRRDFRIRESLVGGGVNEGTPLEQKMGSDVPKKIRNQKGSVSLVRQLGRSQVIGGGRGEKAGRDWCNKKELNG